MPGSGLHLCVKNLLKKETMSRENPKGDDPLAKRQCTVGALSHGLITWVQCLIGKRQGQGKYLVCN